MDSKVRDLPGLNPLAGVPIRSAKRHTPVVPPVEKTGKGKFRSIAGGDRPDSTLEEGEKIAVTPEEKARLATEILSGELPRNQELEVNWTLHKESGQLVVEVKDKTTGEVLRQLPPDEILRAVEDPKSDCSGLLVDRTA